MLYLHTGQESNPNRARALIESQPGVVAAEVWQSKGGNLLSRVTIVDESYLNAADIQQLCLKELGKQDTPSMILIERARRRLQVA